MKTTTYAALTPFEPRGPPFLATADDPKIALNYLATYGRCRLMDWNPLKSQGIRALLHPAWCRTEAVQEHDLSTVPVPLHPRQRRFDLRD